MFLYMWMVVTLVVGYSLNFPFGYLLSGLMCYFLVIATLVFLNNVFKFDKIDPSWCGMESYMDGWAYYITGAVCLPFILIAYCIGFFIASWIIALIVEVKSLYTKDKDFNYCRYYSWENQQRTEMMEKYLWEPYDVRIWLWFRIVNTTDRFFHWAEVGCMR